MVAEGKLPAKPVLQLGRKIGIKLEAVLAGVSQVGIEGEAFRKEAALGKMGVELFTHESFGTVLSGCGDEDGGGRRSGVGSGVRAKRIAVVGEATEDIEHVAIGLDDVITNTAAIDLAKIEVLELVGFEVGEGKDEDARRDIEIAADTGAKSIGGGAAGVGSRITGIDVGGVESKFVAGSFANASSGKSVAGGRGVATGEGQARVKQAAPEVCEFGVSHFFGCGIEGFLLGVVAHGNDSVLAAGGVDSGAPATTNLPPWVVTFPERRLPSFSVR